MSAGMVRTLGEGTLCVPSPVEVDGIMRSVPLGKVITFNQIRAVVAKRHGATVGCPMCTGIFANMAARAAEEMTGEGKKDITPYWRTLKEGGKLNEKFPGGVEAQAKRLEDEGFTVIPGKGKQPPRVEGFEKTLFNF